MYFLIKSSNDRKLEIGQNDTYIGSERNNVIHLRSENANEFDRSIVIFYDLLDEIGNRVNEYLRKNITFHGITSVAGNDRSVIN